MKGKELDGLVAIGDWYTTILGLAGLESKDPSPSAPTAVDGVDIWPYLTGQVQRSPRTEIPLDHLMHCVEPGAPHACHTSSQTPDFPDGLSNLDTELCSSLRQ